MAVGEITETVSVTAEAPVLTTATASTPSIYAALRQRGPVRFLDGRLSLEVE
jgi:hypothetical protein